MIRPSHFGRCTIVYLLLCLPGGLAAQSAGPDSASCPPNTVPALDTVAQSASISVDTLPPKFRDNVSGVLKRLGYKEGDYRPAEGRWVTALRATWPSGSEHESWHGRHSPGYRLEVSLGPTDGAHQQLSITVRTLCHLATAEGNEKPAEVETMTSMLASMQALAEFTHSLPKRTR